jgi:dTDP-4-amino-4,6-dideoxygalactose transaminase
MYFVHPQLKFTPKNLVKVLFSFFRSPPKKELERLKLMFPQKDLVFCDMGRTAFKLIVEQLGLENSEILFPAYICDIFYPILKKYNISPILVDVEKETFNIDSEKAEQKIGYKTKAILICHTYGLPFPAEKIRVFAKEYNLKIIEDCAHSFGAKIGPDFVGNFGDAALFSFYKQFPSLRGGMAVLNQTSNIKNQKLLKTHLSPRDFLSLLNNFSFFAWIFKIFGGEIAPKIQRKEKEEEITRINRVSLNLFLSFLNDFEKNLKKRTDNALIFQSELEKLGFSVQKGTGNVFSFLSVLVPQNINRDKFVRDLRKYGVFATRIWHTPLAFNPEFKMEFRPNLERFPNTKEIAQRIVNLPLQNYFNKKDLEKIIGAIKKCLK